MTVEVRYSDSNAQLNICLKLLQETSDRVSTQTLTGKIRGALDRISLNKKNTELNCENKTPIAGIERVCGRRHNNAMSTILCLA